ncbi:MAG: hypothetical protein AB1489_42255 [Acidobacteriota bacterium]
MHTRVVEGATSRTTKVDGLGRVLSVWEGVGSYTANGEATVADPVSGDPAIRTLAESIGGRVVAVDRGRQLGQDFGSSAINVNRRVRSPETILRIVRLTLRY